MTQAGTENAPLPSSRGVIAPTWRDRFAGAWCRRGWRGRHTLLRALFGAPDAAILVETRYHTQFRLVPSGYIDGFVLRQGYYESEVLEALRRALPHDGVLWDVGANLGLHAVTLKTLLPQCTVCAFEPAAEMLARMQENSRLNAAELQCFALALSDTDGIAPLHHGPVGNPGMSTLSPWHAFTYGAVCHVATRRGDSLVASGTTPIPDVIKLDVEGHEAAVLRGLAETLRASRCRTVVFEDAPEEHTEPKSLLRAAAFTIRPLVRLETSDHALLNFIAEKT